MSKALYLSKIFGRFIKYEDIPVTSHTPQSCGVWLVARMSSYLINLPEISDRYNSHRFTSLEPTEKSSLYSNYKNAVSKFITNL